MGARFPGFIVARTVSMMQHMKNTSPTFHEAFWAECSEHLELVGKRDSL
jgi:hypothetical protein